MLHQVEGHFDKAMDDYQSLLKLNPDDQLAHNNLAWMLATCDEEHARNGSTAVEHAKKAVEISEGRLPWIIDTLAAAYAESGDFDKAVQTQQQAIQLTTDERQRDDLRTRLELYQQHKPYREKPGTDHAD